jgi:hypothetical protein
MHETTPHNEHRSKAARKPAYATQATATITAPVSDTSARIADILFSVLSFAAPGISVSQAQPAAEPGVKRRRRPVAHLPGRPVLRAFVPRLLPRGLLGLSSGARRPTSAPVRPSCICGPTRRQGQRHTLPALNRPRASRGDKNERAHTSRARLSGAPSTVNQLPRAGRCHR